MGLKTMEEREEIIELEDRAIEIIQSEKWRENILKKMKRGSGTCGTRAKDLTFMSLESMSWKERRMQMGLKTYEKKLMAPSPPNSTKDINKLSKSQMG